MKIFCIFFRLQIGGKFLENMQGKINQVCRDITEHQGVVLC